MATARFWTIKVIVDDRETRVIEGKGKANKEKELRRVCTETAQSTGGEVWVTESQARAWQVWDCQKGDRFATRGRAVRKDAE
ncbi:hypothetical protein DP57_6333 [Burkholderia pseudomallei]|uniref:hypothetical protein n=1 Tax=Burkholderia pseudomallei TaxID=28450 RepID=UPI00050F11CE|nr:hypothetical protein [Burkholderia pseudomallei]KGC70882.1 hypothetical protein DP57_6333 [Burkholderia pseudomallei]